MRGSVALEFLILLLVLILFYLSTAQRVYSLTQGIAEDVGRFAAAKAEGLRILHASRFVTAGYLGTRTVLNVVLPSKTRIVISGKELNVDAVMDTNQEDMCANNVCTWRAELPLPVNNTVMIMGVRRVEIVRGTNSLEVNVV